MDGKIRPQNAMTLQTQTFQKKIVEEMHHLPDFNSCPYGVLNENNYSI